MTLDEMVERVLGEMMAGWPAGYPDAGSWRASMRRGLEQVSVERDGGRELVAEPSRRRRKDRRVEEPPGYAEVAVSDLAEAESVLVQLRAMAHRGHFAQGETGCLHSDCVRATAAINRMRELRRRADSGE